MNKSVLYGFLFLFFLLFFNNQVLSVTRREIINNALDKTEQVRMKEKGENESSYAYAASMHSETDDRYIKDSSYSEFSEDKIVKEKTTWRAGKKQQSSWELGTEVSCIKYEEPGVMEQEGKMKAIFGAYTFRGWAEPSPPELTEWMLRAEAKVSFGEVDYTSNGTGTMDDIDDYMIEVRGLCGYDFPVSKSTVITPYFGLGYRYLNDDMGGRVTSTGHAGYLRESNYYYSPLGVSTLTKLNSNWSVGLTVEYDLFWYGVQKSHLSDVSSSYADLENDQNDGYGLRSSLKLKREGKKVNYFIESFIRYWDIDKSEMTNLTYSGVIIGYGYEPKNESTEMGVKIGAEF